MPAMRVWSSLGSQALQLPESPPLAALTAQQPPAWVASTLAMAFMSVVSALLLLHTW